MAERGPDDATRIVERGAESDESASDMADRTRPLGQPRGRAELPNEPVEVIGRFLVLSLLGRGGMGTVYLAYDPQLDRRVAIKLLHSRTRQAEERLLREAQAMARLDHPNVVKILDVGHWRGQVFLAMDYVEGGSLRDWLRAEPRPWQTILDVLMQAGRGLEAAHAAGLVHRDFKPSNVLVRDRGAGPRVLVIDFGLAKSLTGAAESAADRPIDALDRRASSSNRGHELTRTGTIVGTPAYMAPEQHRGAAVDARSDQFGFCVTLFEALWGRRPFRGATIDEVATAILTNQIAPPPRPARRWDPELVPYRLWRVVARGLASDPEGRWPDMASLLGALEAELDQRGLGRVFAGSALGLLAGALAFAFAQRPATPADPCTGFESAVAAVWSSERADALAERFAAIDRPWARDAAGVVALELDAWTRDWARERGEVCRAAQRHEQSEAQLDAQIACYERGLAELATMVELLLDPQAGPERLAGTDALLAELPDLARCEDPTFLGSSASATPSDPALATELTALHYLYVTGEYDRLEAELGELAPRVEAAGDRVSIVELRRLQGQLDGVRGRYDSAELAYEDSLWSAIAIGRDDLAIAALGSLATLIANQQLEPERARPWLRHAQALIERHDEFGPLVAANHAYDQGVVEFAAGSYAHAREHVELALDLQGRVLPSDHPDIVDSRVLLGAIASSQGDDALAQAEFERALADVERRWGPEHPLAADLHNNLAVVLIARGQIDAALEHARLAIEQRRQLLGDAHPDRLHDEANYAGMLSEAGRYAEADEHFARAEQIADDRLAPGSLHRVALLGLHARHLERLGQIDAAIAERRAAIALLEASPSGDRAWAAELRCAIGRDELGRGRVAEALVELERCEPIVHERGEPLRSADVSLSLAEALQAAGRPADRERIAKLVAAARAWVDRAPEAEPELRDRLARLER